MRWRRAYYRSYNNCDYNGTGIQLKVAGEVSPTEEELINLIAPAGAVLTSKYELIEYVNDVNRQYVEVLVEQNINGRTDTTYTYGVDRISRELFNQTSRTSYYLYDPRGSVAGLADAEGHLTKTYRYGVTGELTYGSASYENEYTYNGESYNPNIHSQYLRARYYNVAAADFLTEDSYLGNINEPLTLNRYNYCISNYLNYVDPSGNQWSDLGVLGTKVHEKFGKWAEKTFPNTEAKYEIQGYEYSPTGKGIIDVLMETNNGMEVYELKRAWQVTIYGKEIGDIKEERSIKEPFLPGWKQREGYIRALENTGADVNAKGNTIGEYIMEKGLELYIDEDYTAKFYAYPDQPGMIYYYLKKNPEPDPGKQIAVSLSDSGNNAQKKSRGRTCKTIQPEQIKKVAATTVEVGIGAAIVETFYKVFEALKTGNLGWDNVFFIPISYDIWELQLRQTMPSEDMRYIES